MALPLPQGRLRPYLCLSHRLSLAPFAFPIIAVCFVSFRFYLLLRSTRRLVQNAKSSIIQPCLSAQSAGSNAVSIPRWMAIETNVQLIRVSDGVFDNARNGLNTSVTVLKNLVVFPINIVASFLGCLFELLLGAALDAIQLVLHFVAEGLDALASAILSAVSVAQSVINDIINGANDVLQAFGLGSHDIPDLDVPVNALNITIPDPFSTSLTNMGNSTPTLDTLIQDLDLILFTPFTAIQNTINDTFTQVETSFLNPNTLPIPDMRTLEICDSIDLSDVDAAGNNLLSIIRRTAIGLAIFALVLIVANLIIEYYRWRSLRGNIDSLCAEERVPSPAIELTKDNIRMIQSRLHYGLLTTYLTKLPLHSPTRHSLSWFLSYITYPSALMFLLIGLLGLIVVGIQLAQIAPLEQKYANLNVNVTGNYTSTISDSINHALTVDTATYTNNLNQWFNTTQLRVNHDLFGLATTASNAVNDTIVRLYDDIESGLNDVLGGSFLGNVTTQFLQCYIGGNIDELAEGLAWIQDHLHLTLPHINSNLLSIQPSSISEMATSINAAANSGPSGFVNVENMAAVYRERLKREMMLYGIFLGGWALVILQACGILLWGRRNDRPGEEEQEGKSRPSVEQKSIHSEHE